MKGMSAEQDEDLSLIDEGLRSLRGALEGRTGLRVLNVHSNHLVSVADADLGAFLRLRELNLSSNDLCTLDGVQTLSTLEVLNISSNRLAAIDVPIVKLTSLRSINLSYNRIASLAPLGDLGRAAAEHPLASLQLQGNQLTSLSEPAQLRHFRHLSEVVFRRDSSGNPLCELPGYPSAVLRDGLPACVARLDGVPAELLAQEPPAPAVVSVPEAPEPKPVQLDVLSSPPPSPWVSVAGSDGTPPKTVAAGRHGTPHIDAALNSFKSRHDASRRTSDPGSVQTEQAAAAAAKVASSATSKRMLYALDQELRLEKLETHLAQIVAGIDIGGPLGGRAGHGKPESQRKPYRPRLPVDPAQPGLGRNLQRPVAYRRRHGDDAWSMLSEEDFKSTASENPIDQSMSLSTSDGSTECESDLASCYEDGDRNNPWGSKRKAAQRTGDDPSRDKENFGGESAADAASWSELEENDGEPEDYRSTDDTPSGDQRSVTDIAEASGRDTSLRRVNLTQQQSRLLSPRRRKNALHARKLSAQHSKADKTQSHGHDHQDGRDRKKRTDTSEDPNAPAETTTVGAMPNSKTRRPTTKTRQIELEKAYAREQEQVKHLMQKLEAIEKTVADHAAQQESQTKALQEELETERVLRAEVQQLRVTASSDKIKAEAAANDAMEKCAKEEEAHHATATALAEAQRTLDETTSRIEQKEQELKQKADELSASHQMEATLAMKLKNLQDTLHGLEEEWSAREAAADDVLGGLKADFERAKRSAERAEQARAKAQEHADTSARATQTAKQQAAALADRHNEVTGKLELDIEAYRRSESMLQQKLNDLSEEMANEKKRHAELTEKQSSMHAAQVHRLMAEVTEHQKQQSVENNEQLVAQRQLIDLEERGIEQRKAALHKQQELELGMMQASNKVRELKELLRVSITKEARSASSSRELSLCVKALREKLLDRDDECTRLRQALAKGEADTQDQASRHTLAINALEVQLTTARNQLEDATEKLRRAQAASEDMRDEMSAKVAELQAAVDDQGAAAAHEANQRVAALTEELEEAESALKVKEAVCADQAESLRLAKQVASKAEEVANRRMSELEERTNSLEQEQELTADLRSQLLGKEREIEEMEEECDRLKTQADEDEKMLDQYVSTIREKDEMLSFIDQEVEDLKAMFTEKEQSLVDQLTKQSTCTSETAERIDILEAENAQLLEAAAQHDATMARLTGQLRTKEKECDAATDRVASVEDEMRILLREMAQQKSKIANLSRAFADIQRPE